MNNRRTLILIAAVALGAVAAVALYQYVGGVEERAYGEAERVPVYVVRQDVPKGLFGDEAITAKYVDTDEIPKEFRPSTFVTDLDAIRGKVALNHLARGQVLVEGMFVDPATAKVTFAQRVQDTGGPDQVAVTVRMDQVKGVAGLLVPGDRVNIMVVQTAQGLGAQAPQVGPDGQPAGDELGHTRVLYQNVEILAIGQSPVTQPGEEVKATPETDEASGLITFNVPIDAAARIVHLAETESIHLALVPPDYEPRDIEPVTPDNVFDAPLTPYPATERR